MDVHCRGGLFSQNIGLEVCLNMGAVMSYRLCIIQLDIGQTNEVDLLQLCKDYYYLTTAS